MHPGGGRLDVLGHGRRRRRLIRPRGGGRCSDGGPIRPGAVEPTPLVRASFEFLLAREPRGSILRRFELPVIEQYFPEYPQAIAAGTRRTRS
jgi:hypothetical protein